MHLSHISIYGAAVLILIKCAWKAIVPVLTRAAMYNLSTLLCEAVQAARRIWKMFSLMAFSLLVFVGFWGVYLIASNEWVNIQEGTWLKLSIQWWYFKSSLCLFLQIITGTCCGLRCDFCLLEVAQSLVWQRWHLTCTLWHGEGVSVNDLRKGETVGKTGLKQTGVTPILPAWSKVWFCLPWMKDKKINFCFYFCNENNILKYRFMFRNKELCSRDNRFSKFWSE